MESNIRTNFLCSLVNLIVGSVIIILIMVSSEAMAKKIDLTEMTIEELMNIKIKPVVSVSKYEQKTFEAPASVTIITSDEIKKYGYRSIADLLQGVRGFYMTYDRNYHYTGFRGFNRPGDYSTRILLLLDGVRINDNIFDSAPVGTDFILDMDLIDSVEIVRGPSYALYGNNAFFTVINVISKNGSDMNGVEIGADIRSFDTYNGRISYGDRIKEDSQLLFSGSLYESTGQSHYYTEFDTADQNNGVAAHCDRDESESFFAKYTHRDLTFEAAYINRDKQIPTAPWGIIFNDPGNKARDERAFLDLKLEHHVSSSLNIVARATYGLYNYDGTYLFFGESSDEAVANKDVQEGRWWSVDVHFTQRFANHMLIAGGEYRDNYSVDQKNYDATGFIYLDDQRNTSNWGLFAQDEFSLLSAIKLNVGLRYDHFSTFGDTVNPRVALIYRPFLTSSFKYLTGRAFRAPSTYELFYNDGENAQKANPNLSEEKITSHEIVWEQIIGKYLTGTLTGYHYKIKGLISQTTGIDNLLVFVNQDNVNAYGIEAELSALFQNGLNGRLSYAFQESDYEDSPSIFTNSPDHLIKMNLSIPLVQDSWYLSIEEQYTGRLKTLSNSSAGQYLLTNVTLYWRGIGENLDLSGSVYNLLDYKYSFPGCDEHVQDKIEQDGISFRVKLNYKF